MYESDETPNTEVHEVLATKQHPQMARLDLNRFSYTLSENLFKQLFEKKKKIVSFDSRSQ